VQPLTEKVFRLAPPGGLFDDTVVVNVLPKQSRGARRALVHRAVRQGEVLRLKPGLYCLAEPFRRTHPHPFVVAAMLHFPSQVSLESALSFHGLIPEATFQVASVTLQRSRVFRTPLGRFEFARVPCNDLRAGVQAVKVDQAWAFVATPLRAIADLVYLRRRVSWQADGLGFLTDSLRVEPEDLAELSLERFQEVYDSIRNKRVRDYLVGMRKELEP